MKDLIAETGQAAAVELGPPLGPPASEPAQPPSLPGISEPDSVLLGVSAPRSVKKGSSFIARFVAYIKAVQEAVEKQLEELGRGRSKTHLGMQTCRWRRDTPVTVRVACEQFTVKPPQASFSWNGEQNRVDFEVSVAPDAPDGWVVLRFEVFIEGVPVAFIPLNLKIAANPQSSSEARGKVSPARTAFASYASPDRARVMDKISAVCAYDTGLEVFTDCLDLKPGEEWKPRLAQEIPSRDLFLLFWSACARKSHWVEWEWKTALACKDLSAILPVPLDSPEDAPPPYELERLHFRDRYLWVRESALSRAGQRHEFHNDPAP